MKVYRGLDPAVLTDKQPTEYLHEWRSYRRIYLDGTKTSASERNTFLQLQIEDEDVIALFEALIENEAYNEDLGRIALKLVAKANAAATRAREFEVITAD